MTEHGGHPVAGIGDLLWPVANFVPFAVFLGYYLRGPVREFFRSRSARIREALEAGMLARRAAEKLRSELEEEIRNLPTLRERMRADLRATAEHERALLIEAGRE